MPRPKYDQYLGNPIISWVLITIQVHYTGLQVVRKEPKSVV